MTTIDDAKLEQLAARRPKELFPILERTSSLSPLLVVLTFLPGIVALESASIDEVDAQWRLKSLELSTAGSLFDVIDPSGISTDGMRHVTGKLDPAMYAKPISRDVSYICFAQSQFHERCLSLNIGTDRPLSLYTLTICSKNSQRGYFVWPFSLRG